MNFFKSNTAPFYFKLAIVLVGIISLGYLTVIVGSKVKINAFITLIGVVMGEMIWGIPGMFLSIPVIAVAKIIFDRVESLNEWGMLLGDEEIIKKTGKKTG